MKVKAIKRYSDIIQKKIVEKDTEFDVSEDRAKYLKGQGMVEILDEGKATAQKEEPKK